MWSDRFHGYTPLQAGMSMSINPHLDKLVCSQARPFDWWRCFPNNLLLTQRELMYFLLTLHLVNSENGLSCSLMEEEIGSYMKLWIVAWLSQYRGTGVGNRMASSPRKEYTYLFSHVAWGIVLYPAFALDHATTDCFFPIDFAIATTDCFLPFHAMMPRYDMDTVGTRHWHGKDTNFKYKKWSIKYDMTWYAGHFEESMHHGFHVVWFLPTCVWK